METSNELTWRSMMTLLSNQTIYIDQLKKEKELLNDELKVFQQRLNEVIAENQSIYDEMQSDVVKHTIDASHAVMQSHLHSTEQQIQQFSASCPPVPSQQPQQTTFMHNSETTKDIETGHHEVNELKSVYQSKLAAMEAQLRITKSSLQEALNENEHLIVQINLEASKNVLKKSSKENVDTAHINLPVIERLTKERDDLLKTLTAVRSSLSQSQSEQAELRQEVQKSLATLEDIQLEKTQVMVEKEQLKEAFQEATQKLHNEINDGHKRALDAAAKQRALCVEEINDLQRKIGELLASSSHYENSLEKCAKEKSMILLQLEECRSQLLQNDKDMVSMKMEVEHEVKSALKGYSGAEQELRDAKVKLEQELLKTNQERARYEQEVIELQQRSKEAEVRGLKTQELNVALTEDLHRTQSKKDKLKEKLFCLNKTYESQHAEQCRIAEEKIEILTSTLQTVEIEYEKRLTDLENISCKQSKLIGRLRSECKTLGDALQNLANKHRVEVGKLTQKFEQAKVRVARLDRHNKELSQQCVQHGVTHRQMQERLLEVTNRARVSTNHVIELLDRQSQDEKVNEVLKKEVEYLQSFVIDDKRIS